MSEEYFQLAQPVALFLMGPTASGKTGLAMELASRYPCEIISVDSAMVYRRMDIGTAKPSPEELLQAPHRLIDICEPSEVYSAARFRADAIREMQQIVSTGRIPLLVGGTMLYFKALEFGLSDLPQADASVRERLAVDAQRLGWPAMHRRLAQVDPGSAVRIHPNDPQRIQRALEVYEVSGLPLSQLQRRDGSKQLPFRLLKLALAPRERRLLHQRIAQRFHGMLDRGFEQEVSGLLGEGLAPDLPSMRSVGYRQMVNYLAGIYDRNVMIERGIVATRQLAKRQMTWLRRYPDVHWLDEERGSLVNQVLKLAANGPTFT